MVLEPNKITIAGTVQLESTTSFHTGRFYRRKIGPNHRSPSNESLMPKPTTPPSGAQSRQESKGTRGNYIWSRTSVHSCVSVGGSSHCFSWSHVLLQTPPNNRTLRSSLPNSSEQLLPQTTGNHPKFESLVVKPLIEEPIPFMLNGCVVVAAH